MGAEGIFSLSLCVFDQELAWGQRQCSAGERQSSGSWERHSVQIWSAAGTVSFIHPSHTLRFGIGVLTVCVMLMSTTVNAGREVATLVLFFILSFYGFFFSLWLSQLCQWRGQFTHLPKTKKNTSSLSLLVAPSHADHLGLVHLF